MIQVVDAEGEQGLDHARRLFRSYAAEFADSIAEALLFQGFEAELAGLPGRYDLLSGCLLLAMEGDTAAGCVAMRDLGDGTFEMKRLDVVSEFLGRGVGRLLVEEITRRARQAVYRRMVLDTVPEMAGAIALHRLFGFVETSPYWDCPVKRTILGYGQELTGRQKVWQIPPGALCSQHAHHPRPPDRRPLRPLGAPRRETPSAPRPLPGRRLSRVSPRLPPGPRVGCPLFPRAGGRPTKDLPAVVGALILQQLHDITDADRASWFL